MISISLCMIVKNEGELLAKSLDSVMELMDEIIIVDMGSKDNTKVIASKYTENIYDFKALDNLSVARNYSFSMATKDYIIWLDPGDTLLEDDRNRFIELKEEIEDDIDIVIMGYNAEFDELKNATMSYYRERLFKRANNYNWREEVHEYIELAGNVITSQVSITGGINMTNSKNNLAVFKKMLSRGRRLSSRSLYYYAKDLYYNKKFDEAIIYYNKYLERDEGFATDKINACYELSLCYKHQKNEKNQLKILIDSIKYEVLRPEICCELGYFYKIKEEYDKAIFWFESGLRLNEMDKTWAYTMNDCWGYIPAVELCVCYYAIGDVSSAIECNDLASKYKPEANVVLYNKEFFSKIHE